jgi:hypothetical protein
MPTNRAHVLGRPIPLLVLAAAIAVGTFSGVGYAATRNTTKPASASHTTAARAWSATTAATKTASAPTKDSSATAGLVWHQLTLLNGWESRQSWGTGPPSYAVSSEGVVYLAGSLYGGNQNAAAFWLPVGARPGYYDCFSIYSNNDTNHQTVGALHIWANGKAEVRGPSVNWFASFGGMSFVVGH